MIRNSVTLLQYAGYLLVVGLASAFYNAATGEAGFNKHGVSGLIACGSAAVVVFILGWLTGKGKEWAAWTGLVLSFILFAYGAHTVFGLLRDVDLSTIDLVKKRAEAGETLTDQAAKNAVLYKAGIFGAMFIFSLLTFLKLGTAVRRSKSA